VLLSGTLIPSEYVRIIGAFQHPTLQTPKPKIWRVKFLVHENLQKVNPLIVPLFTSLPPIWASYSILHKPEVNINKPFVGLGTLQKALKST
jgi:hypothetical protein